MGIPVFANGDITTVEQARRVLVHTGADGVLIGRAALGAPWLPGDVAEALSGRTPRVRFAGRRNVVDRGAASCTHPRFMARNKVCGLHANTRKPICKGSRSMYCGFAPSMNSRSRPNRLTFLRNLNDVETR